MTSVPPLSAATPGILRRPAAPAPGIVHLGLGNFHRAHQAVYTDAAVAAHGGDWGIIGVASRSSTIPNAMHAQDMLYTVVETSPAGATYSVPRVHTDAFTAAANPDRVVKAIGDAGTRIVSLTVTENGYNYTPATGALNLQDPAIQHDLAVPGSPQTPVGQIVRGLQHRSRTHGETVAILSCDNLADNGHHTQRLVREFAALLPPAEASEALAFIDSRTSFPSSMVDRIVPATTDHYRRLVASQRGYTDRIPVPAEPFSMWIVEDNFIAGRPTWEAGGAVFSDEVGGYEQLKVRLLNGTHSLIAYLGALTGAVTIPESVSHPSIEQAARSVLRNEYLPTVAVPRDVDVDAYEEELFTRWRNTALGHRTSQVGSDGSVKLRQRIPLPALQMLDDGGMPHLLALTTAAYLACIAPLPGFDPGPQAHAMEDPARGMLAGLAAGSRSGRDLARKVIGDHHLLGEELAGRDGFILRTGEFIDIIRSSGPLAAIAEARPPVSLTPAPSLQIMRSTP
ncbi:MULTISPECIES: mannitol dehydrogenase family protein [unclassified Arthrobacter]|uniref:mannitol dehydrogenase family protein n=1 Tax=unclassified Arthrobacter TaxID=235627 RepID=UPI00035E8581|nr:MULTISPECIES: mannitol dehydrogenase family protein [unclassified Arthrobacter]BCW54452.1 mannitol dehydrogenase [Arthrobacter sp. StoSoilB19]